MIYAYKYERRRRVSFEKRDTFAITGREMISLKECMKAIVVTAKLIKITRNQGGDNDLKLANLFSVLKVLKSCVSDLLLVEVPERPKKVKLPPKTVFDFDREGFSSRFRFYSPEDVRIFIQGFRIPSNIKIQRYKFTADEVVMISLSRLSYPLRWADIKDRFPDKCRKALKLAFYWFLEFCIVNWGYLVLNNREYWVPRMVDSAEAIRIKLSELPREDWRIVVPPADQQGGFSIFAFIDNTMISMSRPGGGPITDGESAPRVSKEVQQAWWTGWKKLHGMKWQSITMANGMDFEIWGPVSVRHPDAYTLNHSKIEEKLEQCQQGNNLQFKIHGDSAYFDDEYLATGGGRGMASVRESIEWSYKDLKNTWKVCEWKICLKLKNQPIAKMMLVCFILKNVLTTFYGCQTAEYFQCMPPTFDDYISQGPRAHPIPPDIIFSQNPEAQNIDVLSDDESVDDDVLNDDNGM